MQHGQQFRDGIEYELYSVGDIGEPSYFNLARDYVHKGQVEREDWRRLYRV